MNWNDITVQQFQELHRINSDHTLDDMDRATRTIGILYNKSEKEVDEMEYIEFGKLSRACSFLLVNEVPGKAVKSIKVAGKKYAIPYNISELKYRQYVEVISFSNNVIENLHNILASIVQPVRFGFKTKNKVEDHAKIAEVMKDASIVDVYHSCVFFCKLFIGSIEAITKGCLEKRIQMNPEKMMEMMILLRDSKNAMDGCIPPNAQPITKGSL